jgi:hypothetical protein
MKKWKIFTAVLLALLVLVATPLTVMAQGQDSTRVPSRLKIKGGLEIVAPRVVLANQEMSLTVFLRYNQTPVTGAAIWAVSRDRIEALKQEIQLLKEKGLANVKDEDYEAVLNIMAVRLGHTDKNGQLTHVFTETGAYALLATKAGYIPDSSVLAVTEVLVFDSPKRSPLGEEVTITVKQRGTGNPVSAAGVWAVSRTDLQVLKEELQELKAANNGNLKDADRESVLNSMAISLGKTDENGQVKYSFQSAGGYALIAAKKGSIPAITGIAIGASQSSTSPGITPAGVFN